MASGYYFGDFNIPDVSSVVDFAEQAANEEGFEGGDWIDRIKEILVVMAEWCHLNSDLAEDRTPVTEDHDEVNDWYSTAIRIESYLNENF